MEPVEHFVHPVRLDAHADLLRLEATVLEIEKDEASRPRIDDGGRGHLETRGGVGRELDVGVHPGAEFEILVGQLDPNAPRTVLRIEVRVDVRYLRVVKNGPAGSRASGGRALAPI